MDQARPRARSILAHVGVLLAMSVGAIACGSADDAASSGDPASGEPSPPGAPPAGGDPSPGSPGSPGSSGGPGSGGPSGLDVTLEIGLQHVAGTRLRPHWYETAGGDRQFVAWFDTQLGGECAFETASDGALRCLPKVSASVGAATGCAGPHISLGHDIAMCGTPKYVRREIAGCPRRAAIDAVGALTSCTVQPPASYNGALDFYAAGAEVPATTFVKGTRSSKTVTASLAVDVITGDDGSIGAESYLDTTHGSVPCSFIKAADGQLRCLPRATAGLPAFIFADAACSSSPRASGDVCGSTKFASKRQGTPVCDPLTTITALGAPTTGPRYIRNSPTMCAPTGTLSNGDYTVGAEVPATAFASASAKDPKSAARLRPVVLESGAANVRTGWFDTARNEACSVGVAADGTTRCLPQANDAYYYADATCTKLVHMAYPESICEAKYMAVTRSDLSCPPKKRLFAKGASKTGPIYYLFNNVCTSGGTFPYIDSGAELPASSFEVVTAK